MTLRRTTRTCVTIGAAAAVVLVTADPGSAAVFGATTSRVSVNFSGGDTDGESGQPAISSTGRYVAFTSSAQFLVPGDTNGVEDVFVRDRLNDATTRVSLTASGAQATAGSEAPSISSTGRLVAFQSQAALVAHDSSAIPDVYVRDLVAGTLRRVSGTSTGAEANGGAFGGVVSADGQHVAFLSRASNLTSGATRGISNVYVRDLGSGAVHLLSVGRGSPANADSQDIAVSGDGRFVVWASRASNLVAGDTNGVADVFVRDRQSGTTTRLSVNSGGAQANGESGLAGTAVSYDGRIVAFDSSASNLVANDTNGVSDVFVRDRGTGITRRMSQNDAGVQGNQASGLSFGLGMSGDGRFVAFESAATNLVGGDVNQQRDVFVRDRALGTTQLVSVGSGGEAGNAVSFGPAVSRDGRHIAFVSQADDFAPNDNNTLNDIYVRDSFGDTP